jgi:hypothetical protein
MTRTHFYICPSEAVRDDLVPLVATERAMIVPYGMNPEWLADETRTLALCGHRRIAQGHSLLAMAAEKLIGRGLRRIPCSGKRYGSSSTPACVRHLNFRTRGSGPYPSRVSASRVFVLPSLAEGSAEVTYEATRCWRAQW